MVISYYYHTLWLLAGGILGIYCFERDHITCSGVPVYYRFRISWACSLVGAGAGLGYLVLVFFREKYYWLISLGWLKPTSE